MSADKKEKSRLSKQEQGRFTAICYANIKSDGEFNIKRISELCGKQRSSVRSRIGSMGLRPDKPPLEFPTFPHHDDIPIEQVIAGQAERFTNRLASYDAHTWYDIKVPTPGPIGVLWLGDPHVDDNGCNWPQLLKHVELCVKTPRCYGANIGDTTNNWVGRLTAKYADQDTSLKTAQRMAEWLMFGTGGTLDGVPTQEGLGGWIEWLVWIFGNHDQWNDGSDALKRMGGDHIVMHDWEARFNLVWPDGEKIRIKSAHDFAGHSQWNPLHGPMKESQWGEEADLYVCGHKHTSASLTWENPRRNFTANVVRVRGYKFLDEYARRLGLAEQKGGESCLSVLRPYSTDPYGRVINFHDIEAGCRFLEAEIEAFK